MKSDGGCYTAVVAFDLKELLVICPLPAASPHSMNHHDCRGHFSLSISLSRTGLFIKEYYFRTSVPSLVPYSGVQLMRL